MSRREASQETGLEDEQILVTFPPGAQATGRPHVGELSARKQWLGAQGPGSHILEAEFKGRQERAAGTKSMQEKVSSHLFLSHSCN